MASLSDMPYDILWSITQECTLLKTDLESLTRVNKHLRGNLEHLLYKDIRMKMDCMSITLYQILI
jgi:hypothetical protein